MTPSTWRIAGMTGTEDGASEAQLRVFRHLISPYQELRGGVCIGADEQCAIIAREEGLRVVGHPPIRRAKMSKKLDIYHELLPPKEYMDRNTDIAVICHTGFVLPREFDEQLRSGTWATYRRFKKYNKPTIVILPNGDCRFERGAIGG